VAVQDRQLASHVLAVHQEGRAPEPVDGPAPLSPELLRAFIATAKTYQPHFPQDLTGVLSLL
jgi:DNA replicative helicase MCM subunit Mcm2 (Cdc46/Mcm family)